MDERRKIKMKRFTLIIETDDGRVLKVDDAEIKEDEMPKAGGIIKFRARRVIEIEK